MSSTDTPLDVIDEAAGLKPGDRIFVARRFRATAVEHTQASHDALLYEPVAGWPVGHRLRVAVEVCEAAGASALAAHYRALLEREADPAAGLPAPAAAASLHWARLLTTEPRRGDRAAIERLREAGLSDAAVVALAQLVAFLAYQVRVVAGLRALAQPAEPVSPTAWQAQAQPEAAAALASAPATPPSGAVIRINGFTNETLQWHSWLRPVDVREATPEQLSVLDESHAQARSSPYYLTLVHQPRMLRHRSVAYNAIMYAPGGLPRAQRELGAMVVSVTNGCVYCTSVHAQRYAQLARRTDTVEQVFTDPATAGSTPRERAIARLAQALTLRPQTLGASDLAEGRAQGMSDEDLIDLMHAVAIFGWANRLMHNLGEPVAEQG